MARRCSPPSCGWYTPAPGSSKTRIVSASETAACAGRLLVTGFEGDLLAARTRGAIERGERAGVILFKRNLPDRATTVALCAEIRKAAGSATPLIAVDEEGGRVSRMPPGEPRLPSMRELASLDAGAGSAELLISAGWALGRQLRELGFNLDFAPILDVDSNPANPVIGDRSFSSSPEAVAIAAQAFASGLGAGGVLACGKHFPGHGDTDKDSHFDLPVIRHDRARLDAVELYPFRMTKTFDSYMSAHIVVEALAPNTVATFSHTIMTKLLRDELGFQGALFSDDLEMRAVSAERGVEESAVLAIAAGCDILLVCKEEELAERAFEALVREIEKSPAFRERAREAAGRSEKLAKKARAYELLPRTGPDMADVLRSIDEARAKRK